MPVQYFANGDPVIGNLGFLGSLEDGDGGARFEDLLALVLAACGDGDEATDDTEADTTTTEAMEETTTTEAMETIELVIWVAIGGRYTLYGAVIGALLVNYAKTLLTGVMPDAWLFALGGMFVLVTLFLPKGIVGLFRRQAA